jgi:hypothetical protein
MLLMKILIAVYFSHPPFFSYKNLRLYRESSMLPEYHKEFTVHDLDPSAPGKLVSNRIYARPFHLDGHLWHYFGQGIR